MLARQTRRLLSEQATADGLLRWESNGGLGMCGGSYVTELAGADAAPTFDEDDHAALRTSYSFRGRAGRVYRLRQLTSLVPDVLHSEPDVQALRLVRAAEEQGFEELRRANHAAWEEIWRGRPVLVGAPSRWQALADAAHFYLQTSVHPSSPSSTSIFGLSYWPNYHYYRGHVMWDIEMFALPPLLLTSPDSARAMLEFRHMGLEAARHNASMAGYRGAQFPWEASLRAGQEAAPGDGDASAHEHHVSLDVAFAFVQYLHATNDWQFGRERAWPVLRDIGSWLESRVVETQRGFEILRVNGVAEKQDVVDNNAFVNMAASVVAREIVAIAPRIGDPVDGALERIGHDIFVPVDRRTHVIRNHDRYRANEEKGETPEAPAGLFPFTYRAPERVERATYEFYLRLADRYVGAPMLSSMLGVYAARLGDRDRALDLFERGYADFVLPPFTATAEYSPSVYPDQPRAGPFAANLGGFLTTLLYGLPGLELGAGEPDSWCTRPVTLPRGWDAIEVERITVRGRPARLAAAHGAPRAEIAL
jgi:hypothetical protein